MALREIAADLEVNVDGVEKIDKLSKDIEEAKLTLGSFGKSLKNFGIEISEALFLDDLKEFIHGQIELGESIERTATQTGLSIEELQKWQYAAKQSSVSTEEVTTALGRLQTQLGGGSVKRAHASQELAKLGIQTKEAGGKVRPVTEIFEDLADVIAKTEDPSKRAAIAMQVFGHGGRQMLPLLAKGKEGIHAMTEEAEKMGFILGEDFVDASKKASTEQTKLDYSMRSLKATAAVELFPAFVSIVDKVTEGVKWFHDLSKETTFVKSALSALGFVAGIKLLGPLKELLGISKGKSLLENIMGVGKIAGTLAGLALLYVAWDDIFALFTGKKSLIGDFIDKTFGKGESTKGVDDIKQAWKEVIEGITGAQIAGDAFEAWFGAFLSVLADGFAYFGKVGGTAFGTLVAYGGELAASIKNVYAQLTGSAAEKKAAQYNLDIATTTSDKMEEQFADALKAKDMKWFQPVSAAGQIYLKPKAEAQIEQGTGFATGKNGVMFHQTINVHGGDPDKVRHAISQGTQQGLAQHDLQNARQAVRSAAPPQTGNYNPNGNP